MIILFDDYAHKPKRELAKQIDQEFLDTFNLHSYMNLFIENGKVKYKEYGEVGRIVGAGDYIMLQGDVCILVMKKDFEKEYEKVNKNV